MKTNDILAGLIVAIIALLLIVIVFGILSWTIMILWNYALVPIGLPPIALWQALCILILCKLLFGSTTTKT